MITIKTDESLTLVCLADMLVPDYVCLLSRLHSVGILQPTAFI